MTTTEITRRLVALCRESKWEEAQEELYDENVVSIEPDAMPGFDRETHGLPAVIEKGHKFTAIAEAMHTLTVSDPIVASNSFACTMRLDATMKGQGRMIITELCVYGVQHGKVVSEEFHL